MFRCTCSGTCVVIKLHNNYYCNEWYHGTWPHSNFPKRDNHLWNDIKLTSINRLIGVNGGSCKGDCIVIGSPL